MNEPFNLHASLRWLVWVGQASQRCDVQSSSLTPPPPPFALSAVARARRAGKREVIECMERNFQACTGNKLIVDKSRQIVLKSLCVTKGQAKKTKRAPRTLRSAAPAGASYTCLVTFFSLRNSFLTTAFLTFSFKGGGGRRWGQGRCWGQGRQGRGGGEEGRRAGVGH